VLDLMEPLRPVVDRLLMEFVAAERFSPSDFSISRTGLCRLHPQLARRVVQAVSRSPILTIGMAETHDGTTKRKWLPPAARSGHLAASAPLRTDPATPRNRVLHEEGRTATRSPSTDDSIWGRVTLNS